jgi:hypothetical protein
VPENMSGGHTAAALGSFLSERAIPV